MRIRPTRLSGYLSRLAKLPSWVRSLFLGHAQRDVYKPWSLDSIRWTPHVETMESRDCAGSMLNALDMLPSFLVGMGGGPVAYSSSTLSAPQKRKILGTDEIDLQPTRSGASLHPSSTITVSSGNSSSTGSNALDFNVSPWFPSPLVSLSTSGNDSGSSSGGGSDPTGGGAAGGSGTTTAPGDENQGTGSNVPPSSSGSGSSTSGNGSAGDPNSGTNDPAEPSYPEFHGLTEDDFNKSAFTLYSGVVIDSLSTFNAAISTPWSSTDTVEATTLTTGTDSLGHAYETITTSNAELAIAATVVTGGWQYDETFTFTSKAVTTWVGIADSQSEVTEASGYQFTATNDGTDLAFSLAMNLSGGGAVPLAESITPEIAGASVANDVNLANGFTRTIGATTNRATNEVIGSDTSQGGWSRGYEKTLPFANTESGDGYTQSVWGTSGVSGSIWSKQEFTTTQSRNAGGIITRSGTGTTEMGITSREWYDGQGTYKLFGTDPTQGSSELNGTSKFGGDATVTQKINGNLVYGSNGQWTNTSIVGTGTTKIAHGQSYDEAGEYSRSVNLGDGVTAELSGTGKANGSAGTLLSIDTQSTGTPSSSGSMVWTYSGTAKSLSGNLGRFL